MMNPFIVSGRIVPQYFCDREEESRLLTRKVLNGNNVVLISPRRMGKTGLIRFCYETLVPEESNLCLFIDILQTTSLKEFTFLLGKEIYDNLVPRSKRLASGFIRSLKSLTGKIGYDALQNMPSFSLSLGDIERPEYTLGEIFEYLCNASKHCIVAIDEFQQITKYPEKNVEAILRTYIQDSTNCNFIFAGSERHLMQAMFTDGARPFYNSCSIMELEAIPKEVYGDFVVRLFDEGGKRIAIERVYEVYDNFEGHTYYMQRVFNECFSNTADGNECTAEIIERSLKEIIGGSATLYQEILSNIPVRQKEVLYSIAKAGNAKGVMSTDFIKRNGLSSASSVQAALVKLQERDLLTRRGGRYSLTDKFLGMWIREVYG